MRRSTRAPPLPAHLTRPLDLEGEFDSDAEVMRYLTVGAPPVTTSNTRITPPVSRNPALSRGDVEYEITRGAYWNTLWMSLSVALLVTTRTVSPGWNS